MDTKDSKAYVAELLQQLEELKKKKARLQKLKKLKKSSSYQGESGVKDKSRVKTDDISFNNDQQERSGAKCSKCGLCLISKDSPCIQCLSAEQKENNIQNNSESTNSALEGGSKTFCSSEIDKHSNLEEEKQGKEAIVFNSSSVVGPLQNSQIVTNLNESRPKVQKNHRKRFTTEDDELVPSEQCNTKKLKLSEKNSQRNTEQVCSTVGNIESITFSTKNNFSEKLTEKEITGDVTNQRHLQSITEHSLGNVIPQVGGPKLQITGDVTNQSCFQSTTEQSLDNVSLQVGGRKLQITGNITNESYLQSTTEHSVESASPQVGEHLEEREEVQNSDAVAEESFLHNMSLFFSPDMEDDKAGDDAKQLASNNPGDVQDDSGIKRNFSSFPDGNCKGLDIDKDVEQAKARCYSDIVRCSGEAENSEASAEKSDCVRSLNTSQKFGNVLDTFTDVVVSGGLPNLGNVSSKDSNPLEQLDNISLCCDNSKNGNARFEILEQPVKKLSYVTEVCEGNTKHFPEVTKINAVEHKLELEKNVGDVMPTDSQLIEDLKTSEFSSFENSNSAEDLEGGKCDNHTPSLLDSSEKITMKMMFDDIIADEAENIAEERDLERKDDNKMPNLLDFSDKMTKNKEVEFNSEKIKKGQNVVSVVQEKGEDNKTINNVDEENIELDEQSLKCIPETSGLRNDKSILGIEDSENMFADDGLTADIDFECTSLEVADTMDLLQTKSSNGPAVSPSGQTSADHDVFIIPETELLEISHFNNELKAKNVECTDIRVSVDIASNTNKSLEPKIKSLDSSEEKGDIDASVLEVMSAACDEFEETQCDTLDQLQTIPDSVFLDAEDSLELGNYRKIPFAKNEVKKTSSTEVDDRTDEQESFMKYVYCLQSDVKEPVNDVKFVLFNNSSYAFILHVTWIQVWRQEASKDWSRIFTHQVEDELRLKEICFTKDDRHLILVMLLSSQQGHCLQFLLFESEARVIKLMEHTHWLQNRCPGESVLLCGLDNLRFATAQGKETFEVFLHVFRSMEDSPRLGMAALGSTASPLHSLCDVQKLPNALMGTGATTLYLWHLLEARLVTSVSLQLPDLLSFERCIWATIENGLVFFMAVCAERDGSQSCKLLATNLATGFCEIAMSYSFLPSLETASTSNRNLKAVYSEPFLAISCKDGGFLWSATDEYCCASLDSDVTSVNIGSDIDNPFLVVVGNSTGCVNCYGVKCA